MHSIIYRLILGAVILVGAVILAFVIPVWASGHQPMWPVALVTVVVVTAAGVMLARQPGLHDWLLRR